MIAYLITFAISIWGVWEADIWYDNKRLRLINSLVALLPPILLAGFRDSTVGYDVEFYILPVFNGLISSGQDLLEFFDSHSEFEKLYLFLNFLVAQVTDQYFVLLLIIHSLIIIPLYVAAMKWRNYLSPALFFFIFYMIFFQESLSIVRQGIAMSFSILALTYFLERKYYIYAFLMLIGFGFHNTAVIALSYPIIFLVVDRFSVKRHFVLYIGLLALFFLFVLNIESVIIWLVENDHIDYKYLKYVVSDGTFEAVLGATNFVVKLVTILYIVYLFTKYIPNTMLKFFLVLAMLDLVFSLCALILQPLDRISLYFRIMSCIFIPYLLRNCPILYSRGAKQYQIPVVYLWGILLFVYWYYVYILGGYDSTSDYQLNNELFS